MRRNLRGITTPVAQYGESRRAYALRQKRVLENVLAAALRLATPQVMELQRLLNKHD